MVGYRYQMTVEPYNVFFLPIFAPPDEIQLWEKEKSKETFFKFCNVNFTKHSFNILSRMNG